MVQVKSKYKHHLTLLIGSLLNMLKTYMSYHAVKNPRYNHHHDFKLCISKFTVDTKGSFAIFSYAQNMRNYLTPPLSNVPERGEIYRSQKSPLSYVHFEIILTPSLREIAKMAYGPYVL